MFLNSKFFIFYKSLSKNLTPTIAIFTLPLWFLPRAPAVPREAACFSRGTGMCGAHSKDSLHVILALFSILYVMWPRIRSVWFTAPECNWALTVQTGSMRKNPSFDTPQRPIKREELEWEAQSQKFAEKRTDHSFRVAKEGNVTSPFALARKRSSPEKHEQGPLEYEALRVASSVQAMIQYKNQPRTGCLC